MLDITSRSVGSMDNNAYLLRHGGQAVLVDAADDPAALRELIGDADVTAIVTTHRHPDHIRALAALASETGAELIAGAPDADAIADATGVTIDRRVWDGDEVFVGPVPFQVIGLVGHTPGSIALAYTPLDGGPTHLFTGDSLFPGGVGRTLTPKQFESLFHDVTTKLFDQFADDTVVHPGHGASTTLGHERPNLAEWRARGW